LIWTEEIGLFFSMLIQEDITQPFALKCFDKPGNFWLDKKFFGYFG